MLNIIKDKYCKFIQICGKELENLFVGKSLEKITIESVINCCEDKPFKKQIHLSIEDNSTCMYKVEFCTDYNDNPHTQLNELNIFINGQNQNILNRFYNIIDNTDVLLLEQDILNYLSSYGISNIELSIAVYSINISAVCISFIFKGLPSGVKPNNIVLINPKDPTCYEQIKFICYKENEICKRDCTESIVLTDRDIYEYRFRYLILQNKITGEYIDSGYVATSADSLIHPSNTFGDLEDNIQTGIDYINNIYELLGITGLNIEIVEVGENEFKICMDRTDEYCLTHVALTVKPKPGSRITNRVDFDFEPSIDFPDGTEQLIFPTFCTEFEVVDDIQCIYEACIETQTEIGPSVYLQSITAQSATNIAPAPIIAGSYHIIEQQADIITLNTIGNLEIVQEGNTVCFRYTGLPDSADSIPYAINIWNASGCVTQHLFVCKELISTPNPDEYNPNEIEVKSLCYCPLPANQIQNKQESIDPNILNYRGNCLLVKPGFWGFNTEEIPDGIYHIKLTLESKTQKYIQEFCIFIDCKTKCKIAAITDSEKAVNAAMLHTLTHWSIECTKNCACKEACNHYGKLLKTIKDATTAELEGESCSQC